ncbi:ABC transporter ATP-binding protein [Mesorhizobium australafricanum]|uniref:ABC transporter ATP-binding protein n=1 Tax=Mesorhizobium australafricanum TaxID=3072311 RepID=A0ABU4WW25_9HYPH|nr:ABC transporter ATP-binding protein [Mesorhizobium sp. VK3E]MDX8440262.1 ABC transporter ATP-binding protein [Mesorhizobium sp. VK3E]
MAVQERNGAYLPVLAANSVSVSFGGVQALDNVSLDVGEGEICGLIGPNGAGKTTFLNAITCLTRPQRGSIKLSGRTISNAAVRDIIGLGVARTFQNIGVYGSLSVLENVMLGAHHKMGGRVARALLNPFGAWAQEKTVRRQVESILDELGMAALSSVRGDSLPYPLQKRMEIARALAAEPKLLLLDEPAGGLTHGEVSEFGALVNTIRHSRKLSILLIEHHMGLVMSLCDRIHVFHLGRNLASGRPEEIRTNEAVIDAYLGRGA